MSQTLIQDLQAALTAGLPLALDGTRAAQTVVPSGYVLEDLERFQEAPRDHRGAYTTNALDSFVDYVQAHARVEHNSTIFIDAESLSARAVLDQGNPDLPQWGRHTATLTLDRTPAYAALLVLNGTRQSAAQLVDWIIDWAEHLAFYAGDPAEGEEPTLPTAHAIQALRRLKTESGKVAEHAQTQLGASRSVLEQARVTSDPPGGMVMRCRAYEDLAPIAVTVRLGYLPQDPPQIAVRILGLGTLKLALAREFAQRVRDALTQDAIPVYLGTFKR